MLIEKMIFNMLAFSLFIIIFVKLIKKNDTNYLFFIIPQALGIALNFGEIIFGWYSTAITIIEYVFSIIIPLIVIFVELKGYNISEIMTVSVAKVLIKLGDSKLAKDILLNLVEKYDSYKGHLLLAKIYEKDGGMRKAIDEYVTAIDINKQDYDSYYRIAELLNELDRKDEAITMLNTLLKNKPDYYNASVLLGELLCNEERFKEAVSVYMDALVYRPTDYDLYYSLGIAYTRLNDFPSAKECYEKAAEINHKFYLAYYNLGLIALIEKDIESAEKFFYECLMSDELEAKAYYQLAKICVVRKEKDKAINFANKAIELDDTYLDIILNDDVFEPIKEHISVSVKLDASETKEVKKLKKEDELVQIYLEETYNLIEDLNDNEIRDRANKRVDEIFKLEEERRAKEVEKEEKDLNLN